MTSRVANIAGRCQSRLRCFVDKILNSACYCLLQPAIACFLPAFCLLFAYFWPASALDNVYKEFSIMESGFIKANSSNLPRIDCFTIANFFATSSNFCSAEFRNVKTSMSARQSYGDDAVGYVQLRRDANLCTVKCKICPEHKVHTKPYSATIVVNEENCAIVSVDCHDCGASQGGCKHAVALIMWVHRRSEEPPCTSVECYWKKSRLAKVGTTLKFVTAKELSKGHSRNYQPDPRVLNDFLKEGKKRNLKDVQLIKYHPGYSRDAVEMCSMHQLCLVHKEEDSEEFLVKAGSFINKNTLVEIEKLTKDQSQNKLWFELRYGRITASKAYDVSKCKTPGGSLVEQIMGGKLPDTPAMKRGRKLEDAVFKIVEVKLGVKIEKCGLIISKDHLMIAGSPDGICNEFVIEIKCPTSLNAYKNYIRDQKPTQKYYAQMQLQMFLSGKKKCYFCVADINFEITKSVDIICVNLDTEYVNNLLTILSEFWKTNIYPLLNKSVK